METKHNHFVVFLDVDDCTFDFMDYKKLWERLLLTNGIERAKFASRTPAVETMVFMDYLKLF